MIKILGLFPFTNNGGITSWAKKYLSTFPNEEFLIIPVNNEPSHRRGNDSLLVRIYTGLIALKRIVKDVKQTIKQEKPQIMHTTTSGSLGALRDYIVGRICRKNALRCIMHCRYGCIPEDITSRSPIGALVRLSMRQYDQIWVLDTRSYSALNVIPEFSGKVKLTPNSIIVPNDVNLSPKQYTRIGFVGNLIPSKGLYELVEACTRCQVRLDIIGGGHPSVVNRVKSIAGTKLNESIFLQGRLPNDKAVSFMKELDIIALPTYYPSEAFPISILEAMSLGKLVISCPRAAIKDMLTDLNDKLCGLLVEPKSATAIEKAIKWAQIHKVEADKMCQKAYDKVRISYDTTIVYEQYRMNYRELLP